MVPARRIAALAIVFSGLLVQGCGQKGPLYREASAVSMEAPAAETRAAENSGDEKSDQETSR